MTELDEFIDRHLPGFVCGLILGIVITLVRVFA